MYCPIIVLKIITSSLSWSPFTLLAYLAFPVYLFYSKLNPFGPVRIESGFITKKASKVAIDLVDWDSANLDDSKVHLFPKGKEWSDGVKLNLKRLDPALREKLKEISHELIGKSGG